MIADGRKKRKKKLWWKCSWECLMCDDCSMGQGMDLIRWVLMRGYCHASSSMMEIWRFEGRVQATCFRCIKRSLRVCWASCSSNPVGRGLLPPELHRWECIVGVSGSMCLEVFVCLPYYFLSNSVVSCRYRSNSQPRHSRGEVGKSEMRWRLASWRN